MGLATPVAIMAGSNAAADRGILIRDGVALEKAGLITAVLFDKTGTLTVGKPSVVKVWENKGATFAGLIDHAKIGVGESLVGQLAASLAQHSTHPVSQAVAKVSSKVFEFENWEEVRGAGVKATVQVLKDQSHGQPRDAVAQLGSLRWLAESGVDSKEGAAFIGEWSPQGATIVGLSVGRNLWGLFAIKDTLKPGAREVVEQLQRQGLKIWLVTGDNQVTASSIAKQVGIENVFAEIRPGQKAELVKKLQDQGERVAFAGDGINDAPALEQADLGIAVSRASDVAREAADIILLKSEIEAVPESLGLARATLRTIKQNLFWAFFYNAVGVPLAALGFMSPILCAAAMGLSDLVVIGNALRLRRWRLEK
jgi:Cu+-exporting ATPase